MGRIISRVLSELRNRDDLPPLRDRIRPGVRVLFVGINPGVRSSLTGHHFAGFSNRFWKLLYESRLVPEPITFADDDRLPDWGYGITNLVPRPTPGIDTLRPDEYVAGRARLRARVRRFKPDVVAMVGVTVYRAMFPGRKDTARHGRNQTCRAVSQGRCHVGDTNAPRVPCRKRKFRRVSVTVACGLQEERLGGSAVFVLPNPSGRNANYSYGEMLAAFRTLRRYLNASSRRAAR